MPQFGEQFLNKRESKLHTSKPVEHEQARKKRKGEGFSDKPVEKITDWLEVIKQTHMGHRDDPRVLERIKNYYHKQNVIKPEDIPESYFETQKRLAREQGHGDIEITEEIRDQLTEVIKSDQESTLDNWIDYFTDPDSDSYPMWAKYWAWNGMLKLSTFDKEKQAFSKRKKDTVAPFPDLSREALAYVVDSVIKKTEQKDIQAEAEDPEFKKLLQGANFGKLYAWAIEKVTPAEEHELLITDGEWVKYDQNSDHMPLVKSLQGHGTGWCTAAESTAKSQLQTGDFYVYYSYDKQGKPTVPRMAIRMQENSIAEVRGIAHQQNMDPYIADTDTLNEKLKDFGGEGEKYKKKSSDMKLLTTIENKTKQGQKLTKDELIFLYEINSPIHGFGYERDPRIKEVRDQRNLKEDAPIVLKCKPQEIAWKQEDIKENTKAYIGPLFKDIFKTLSHLDYIYTSFPEGKITRQTLEIGGQTERQLEKAIEQAGMKISDSVLHMMRSLDFTTEKQSEQADLVQLTVQNIFNDDQVHTTDELYKKAEELGLELCPAEVGPHLRLKYTEQALGDWYSIAMKQITGADGRPGVFYVERGAGGLWRDSDWAGPAGPWHARHRIVFRLRK